MNQSSEIGSNQGIQPTTGRASPTVTYSVQTTKPSKAQANLRAGEIIQGSIVEVFSDKEVSIRLPNGTFKAMLSNKLKAGDSLFFKVIETAPSLVLKIHSVSVSSGGKEFSSSELLRMLDLPDTSVYKDILDFLKSRISVISRDDVLMIYKGLISIKDSDRKLLNIKDALMVLFEMKHAGLPLTPETISRILPLFDGNRKLSQALNKMKSLLDSLPKEISDKLKVHFKGLMSSNPSPSYMIDFFSFMEKATGSFISDLIELQENKNNEKYEEFNKQLMLTLRTIEAALLWNAYAAIHNQPQQIFIPVWLKGTLQVAQMAIKQSDEKKQKKKGQIYFSFDIPTINLGTVHIEGALLDNILTTTISAPKDNSVKLLSKHSPKLNQGLLKHNIHLQSISFVLTQTGQSDHPHDKSSSQPKGFQIVV
ncbi:MAG: hypothetical protein HW421_3627 [Ignavibacteria bacterium]|nr:hypothetical protein [Ignavibacteria bacterium]